MKKKYIFLLFILIFCSQENSIEEVDLTTTSMMEQIQTLEEDATTTTSVEIVQLETFENIKFVIQNEDSKVSYLAPKQFLNSGLDIVEGTTREIIGEFTLTLSDCDQADSCLYIKNLSIRADISLSLIHISEPTRPY